MLLIHLRQIFQLRFSDVVGHAQLKNELVNAVLQDNLAHALLITGKAGYGPLPLALSLSSFLLCENRTNDSCGQCPSCQKVDQLIHPDLHLSFPVVKKEGKARKDTISSDFVKEWRKAVQFNPYLTESEWLRIISQSSAKGDINVAECNQIISQLNLQAFQSGAKVQIVWLAEYLGQNANRLLKLIEEPPSGTFLILIADNAEYILNTIKSRCRSIRVPRIDPEAMKVYIRNHAHGVNKDIDQIAFLSEGDLASALNYLSLESSEIWNLSLDWLQACKSGKSISMRTWIDQFDTFNLEEKKAILNYVMKILRELLHLKVIGRSHVRIDTDTMAKMQSMGLIKDLRVKQIESIHNIVSKSITLLARNVNSKILMFDASLQLESVLNEHAFVRLT